jgi:hypothetical protein
VGACVRVCVRACPDPPECEICALELVWRLRSSFGVELSCGCGLVLHRSKSIRPHLQFSRVSALRDQDFAFGFGGGSGIGVFRWD